MEIDRFDPDAVAATACERFSAAAAAEDEQVYRWRLREGRAAREILCAVPGHTEEHLGAVDAAYEIARSHGRQENWEDQEIPGN